VLVSELTRWGRSTMDLLETLQTLHLKASLLLADPFEGPRHVATERRYSRGREQSASQRLILERLPHQNDYRRNGRSHDEQELANT
jgi:hypothetical protein